ncbi:hypothetical protein F0L74_10805 [Chitinophaga agrisoli]|uniref:Uncharacterized protein n=1 Tax=Chitinophaga agrisoli TaxID=2607653 RepID=A0A5B2VXF8_9BACT|nr:hypothetical protein [Chitinophaga agrisoli]KAA2243002.1 hypothetical protein F0L74_10805 [Chitinophaga agrisoli]
MKQTLTCLTLLLLAVSCVNTSSQTPTATDSAKTITEDISFTDTIMDDPEDAKEERTASGNSIELDSTTIERMDWATGLVANYIDHTDNEGIRTIVNDSTASMKWMWDQLEKRDSSTYILVHLGHDQEDEDGARFATDGWLYIDTLTRRLYEYDLPNDSLVGWPR